MKVRLCNTRLSLQIPGEAEEALRRLRKKLESPGFEGRKISPAALTAIDALTAIVNHLHQWDVKPHQVIFCFKALASQAQATHIVKAIFYAHAAEILFSI